MSRHHRIPTSRGGKDDSIQYIPRKFHDCWHYCFRNLTLDEIHLFIEILYAKNHWSQDQIDELQKNLKRRTADEKRRRGIDGKAH